MKTPLANGSGRGGARSGAGRKKKKSAGTPASTGLGRGGARPGAGRKSKKPSAAEQTALLEHLYRSMPLAEIDRLFALSRAGDIGALMTLIGLYSKAEKAANAPPHSPADLFG